LDINQNSIYQKYIKRAFDIIFSLLLLILFFPLIFFISCLVKISSSGPILYWSDRIGYRTKIFKMPKFRTMRINTPELATDRLLDPEKYLTPSGNFLRSSSLDELPQLFSIIKGDMSFIGPRPALYNQEKLIKMRETYKINNIKPGLTGFAQIKGRDEISDLEKVSFDKFYIEKISFTFDLKIIILSIYKVIRREGIDH